MDSFSVLYIQAMEVRATFEGWATWRMELLLWLPAAMRGAGTSTTRRARSWRQFIIIRYIFVSQADDVSFILELIARVAEDHPAADANNVNLIGTSNGAAIIYRLLIATGIDRPFHRWFLMNGFGNINILSSWTYIDVTKKRFYFSIRHLTMRVFIWNRPKLP